MEERPTDAALGSAPRRDWRKRTPRIGGLTILFVAGAFCWYHVYPDESSGYWFWIAPVPILIFAFAAPPAVAAAGAFAICFFGLYRIFIQHGYVLNSLNIVVYLGMGIQRWLWIGPLLYYSAFFAIMILWTRWIQRRLMHWSTLFAFPAVWVTFEAFLSYRTGGSIDFSIAHTQARFLPAIQIASVTGVMGVAWLVLIVPSGIATAWNLRERPSSTWKALVATALIAGCALGYGQWRLSSPGKESQAGLAVAVIASAAEAEAESPDRRPDPNAIIDAYLPLVRAQAVAGAKWILLPEKLAVVDEKTIAEVRNRWSTAARENNIWLVVGMEEAGTGHFRNLAWVFDPTGALRLDYDKAHMIAGLESRFRVGDAPGLIDIDKRVVGIAICKDMDFPQWGRKYSQAKAGILFAPALDFFVDGWLHARSAILRGVEGGFAVVRNGQQGLLTVSDDHGRIIVNRPTSTVTATSVQATVAMGAGDTFYARNGDWLPALCALSVIVFSGLAVMTAGKPYRS